MLRRVMKAKIWKECRSLSELFSAWLWRVSGPLLERPSLIIYAPTTSPFVRSLMVFKMEGYRSKRSGLSLGYLNQCPKGGTYFLPDNTYHATVMETTNNVNSPRAGEEHMYRVALRIGRNILIYFSKWVVLVFLGSRWQQYHQISRGNLKTLPSFPFDW